MSSVGVPGLMEAGREKLRLAAPLAGLMLFLSGAAALIYQLTWVRLLGFGIGATAVAVGVTLAAFFGGMALGSLFAQRRLRRGQNGLKGFVLAELTIALSVLLLFPLMARPEWLLAWSGTHSLLTFVALFALLLIPTMAMGTTYPFLAAWLTERTGRTGPTLSRLFALNTLGGVAGVVLAGFLLIAIVGLNGAVYTAAAMNGVAALLGFFLLRIHPQLAGGVATVGFRPPSTSTPRGETLSGWPLLLVLATTGISLMGLEVVWSKYLTIYTGTTLHGFSIMLAAVLAGLVVGAGLLQRWQARAELQRAHLLLLLGLLSLSLMITRTALGLLPSLLGEGHYLGEVPLSVQILLFGAILFLPAVLFGAVFPLAIALYCRDAAAVRQRLGLAYAVNTLAAILGAVATSLWLIPALGTDTTLIIFPLLIIAALLVLLAGSPSVRLRAFGYPAVLVVALLPLLLPGVDFRQVFSSHYYRFAASQPPHTFRYLTEGRTGVISLIDYGSDVVHLQRNGLNEALVHARHAYKGTLAESLLGALPYLLQPEPKDAFVIGFGGGTTTRVLANSGLDRVRTVEIEPRVVEAMMQLGEEQFPFLFDGRVELAFNDARVSLFADSHRYSIIASQLSHPWLVGSANLYSREFFELARARLTPDGIFAQWVNLFRMDAPTLRSILRTFYEVFPRGAVFGVMRSGDLILLGGEQPMVLDYERVQAYFGNASVASTLRYGDLRYVSELPDYFLFTSEEARELAGDAPIATDSNLLVEMRLARLRLPPAEASDPYRLIGTYVQTDLGRYLRP